MTAGNRWWWMLGLGLALAACGPLIGDSVPEAEPVPGLPSGPSALINMTEPTFPTPLIEPREIVRVLPVDAIPAIDTPSSSQSPMPTRTSATVRRSSW